ncbi:MAG: hypothetical protein LBN96_07205 [Desulfovibrio sp.]|jgi:hypothetical protein|nr:hypothetical protein [Desulfovibrio sp.]
MGRLFFITLPVFVCCLCIAGCARMPRKAEQARISADQTIYVAFFTQPTSTSELITGVIPEKQGRIPADMLPVLDRTLRNVLTGETRRTYGWLPADATNPGMARFHASERPQALPHWIEYGKKHGALFLLIPQVLDWHEREGSQSGVIHAARVRLEFFLLDVRSGAPAGRSVYEEEQTGLVDDLLNISSFIRRHGIWVTADVLAEDGMRKAVKDLGL